jgi:glucose-6-phosphate isomerase
VRFSGGVSDFVHFVFLKTCAGKNANAYSLGLAPWLLSWPMTLTKEQLWERFKKYYFEFPSIGLAIDLSRVNFSENFFSEMEPRVQKAFAEMAELEKGAIANPDENRMVGHYWLRNPALAPTGEIKKQIEDAIAAVKSFAEDVHEARIQGERGPFKNILLIGIGGSALGPQFVSHALGHPVTDKMDIYFFDNTDPDGFDKVLAKIVNQLGETLCIVISKSGGTKETRNGMLEAMAAYERAGLNFSRHAVAITQNGSALHKSSQGWLARFPMWDWVGGRTSETSVVGLLPAALQGFQIDQMLGGAAACDSSSRSNNVTVNPSMLLALAWFHCANGKGEKDMVLIPYKDRLELFSRYLQQLIMESLGKGRDRAGNIVPQGMAVYGNKGSTDQHAYVQQLRDGINNFFVTFIEVLRDRSDGSATEVEAETTSGDYLSGFFLGTREALFENGRESISITIQKLDPKTIGALIALFERTVGFYASLININAYHQPGVEAGKKAAEAILALQRQVLTYLKTKKGHQLTSSQIASGIGAHDGYEAVFKICEHLAANKRLSKISGKSPFESTYEVK